MVAIVTGHKGFIGRRLVEHLKEYQWDVYPFDVDMANALEQFETYVQSCDVIFHVGAISDTTLQDPNEMLYWNYSTSKIIFDLAQKYDKKVIYSSSAACYGKGDGIPTNIYGWSKLLAEEYGMKACDKFVALRYFNVYGPGEEDKGKMASVAYQAWKKGSFTLFPAAVGKPIKRDFVYIADVIAANHLAVKCDKGVYDVGTGKAESFEDLVGGMGIEYDYHDESKIPSWYQFYTQADKNKFMPGYEPMNNVKDSTRDYKKYLENQL